MGIYPPPKLGQLRRRDVPEGLISDMRGVSARCPFLPLADIGCGTFMSTRPKAFQVTHAPRLRSGSWPKRISVRCVEAALIGLSHRPAETTCPGRGATVLISRW